MRVCMIAEGCYPYVVGGVSGWVHSMIKAFPEVEFVILGICANRTYSGKFAYELPANISEVYEVYLEDVDWNTVRKGHSTLRLNKKDYEGLRSLMLNYNVDWDTVFDLFHKKQVSVDEILMGSDFLHITEEFYDRDYPEIVFSDFLWTLRSIYLPLFLMLKSDIPKADLYHCVATGYAGVLGAMGKHLYGGGLLVSEHGIYTREREEELIKAKWVQGIYKNIWIEQFRKMSLLAYDRAETVTSLFAHARELQIELGCPKNKTEITPNGVDPKRFVGIPEKTEEDKKYVNVGAVLRVTEIKDVKTMIRAFGYASKKVDNLKLWLMGPTDEDPDYARECMDLVRQMNLDNVEFTGRINTTDYIGRMDFTILTSISEGQPLTILEGYAAHKPAVATDVGNCRGLIYGEDDDFGPAGIVTHIMNTEEIAEAIVELARNPELVKKMGEAGYKRFMSRYTITDMKERYREIYSEFADRLNVNLDSEEAIKRTLEEKTAK